MVNYIILPDMGEDVFLKKFFAPENWPTRWKKITCFAGAYIVMISLRGGTQGGCPPLSREAIVNDTLLRSEPNEKTFDIELSFFFIFCPKG